MIPLMITGLDDISLQKSLVGYEVMEVPLPAKI